MRYPARNIVSAAMMLATTGAAPPYSGMIQPMQKTFGPINGTTPPVLAPDLIEKLLDQQMFFEFEHAVITKNPSGATLKLPPPPTETAQGVKLTLFSWGIVFPIKRSAILLVYSATDKPGTADFRSNAFDLAKRKAVNLAWQGYFDQQQNVPIQLRLFFGPEREIGLVTFREGKVLVGGNEAQIATYADVNKGPRLLHRLSIRADLAKHSYTVRFEEGGKVGLSDEIPFPAGTGPIPAGMQQVTARLTSPKPYAVYYYDLARVSLSGETG